MADAANATALGAAGIGVPGIMWGLDKLGYEAPRYVVVVVIIAGAFCCLASLIIWSRLAIKILNRRPWRIKLWQQRSGIQIVFDENDSRCVHEKRGLYDQISARYWWVGVLNSSISKSIDNITLRALDSQFVQCTIGVEYATRFSASIVNPVILKAETLSPGADEFVKLFELSATDVYGEQDILSKKQTFTLEATARNTPKCTAVLEYDPSTKPPIIRRVS